MNNLGAAYGEGKGVPQDYAEAVRWYSQAAQKGEPMAMYNLGLLYEYGLGVPVSTVNALRMYQDSAKGGEPFAMDRLGKAYETGQLGLRKDIKLAQIWYAKAQAARSQ